MSKLPKDFLWGGAVAAHQLEGGWNAGGKGPSVADIMTAGANGQPREITEPLKQANTIQTTKRLISIIVIKKMWRYLLRWA